VKNANKLDYFCRTFCSENLDLPQKRAKFESNEDEEDEEEEKEEECDSESVNHESTPQQEEPEIVVKEIKIEDLVMLKEKIVEANLGTQSKIVMIAKKRCGNSLRYDGENVIITLEKLTYETYMEIRKLACSSPDSNDELAI